MSENTKVEWADYTWNGHCGCDPVHTGCLNCYAQVYFRRFGVIGKRRKTSAANWRKPLAWNKKAAYNKRTLEFLSRPIQLTMLSDLGDTWRKGEASLLRLEDAGYLSKSSEGPLGYDLTGKAWRPPGVFLSLGDPFEDWQGPIVDAKGRQLFRHQNGIAGDYIDCPYSSLDQPRVSVTMDDLRRDMFHLIDQTPNLDWLLLTKRPGNIRRMIPPILNEDAARRWYKSTSIRHVRYRPNVHLLYSASDQETLEAGIGHLLKCRDLSPVLGLSLEPLVGPIDLSAYISPCEGCGNQGSLAFEGAEAGNSLCLDACTQHGDDRSKLDRVIVGGESGPNARPCKIGWIRDIRDQCAAAGVPLFIKQLGANSTGWDYDDFGVALSDGNDGFAVAEFHDPKGGDWSEWPDPLKVRQSPEVKP